MITNPDPADQKVEILIVEDSATQAEALKYILEQNGYRVTHARDGRQALALLDEYKPTLVISDITMPEMDGYQLCQHIRAAEHSRDIPVILLTALTDKQDVVQGLACGADSFITKPYSANYLLAHIEDMLVHSPLPGGERPQVELQINVAGKTNAISVDPKRILSLGLSTYEAAIYRNKELVEVQEALSLANERLESRTAALKIEIAERERLEKELRSLSVKDELTGLLNRRGFMTLAEQHWRLALRTRQEFALLYLDMDRLKHINDTFGHAQGDLALQAAAQALENSFREADILARIGGDEFAVLITDCGPVSIQNTMLRLKENLEQSNAPASHLYSLSLSAGLANFNIGRPVGIKKMMEQADAAMYTQKKQSGIGG